MRGTWQTTGSGGGRGLLVVLGVLVLLGSGAAVELATAVIEALIAAAVVLVLTVAAGVVWLAWYARRGHLVRQAAAPPSWQQVPGAAPPKPVTAPQPPVINHYHGGTHVHLEAGADPAVVRRALGSEGLG